jgi:hypothetical protein
MSRFHKRSDASADPPGESIRSTTAFVDSSDESRAIVLPSSRSEIPSEPLSGFDGPPIEIAPIAGTIAT